MKIMKIARMQLYKVPVVESRNLLKVLHHNQFSWDFEVEVFHGIIKLLDLFQLVV